jgi:demethylmenaquinone methyltransferase/2-methoxy-6-polyprenyl-1,4-benzoquinol methylase
MSRAGLDKRPAEVASMFDAVAARYDLTNDVLSLGMDRLWRRAVTRRVAAGPAERILDVAAGTATSSLPLAAGGATVVACDFSLGMLARAHRRRGAVLPVAGDALRLPFADGAFDAVTSSFGLRNTVDPDLALREMARVTRPGGRLVLCEFSHPTSPLLRRYYRRYLLRALPALADRVSSDPDSYHYLAESILGWPDQARLAGVISAAGWSEVGWTNLSAGVVAVHFGRRA